MRRLLFSSLALGLLFTACEPGPVPFGDPDKLLATDVTDIDSTILSYDAGGRLILFERYKPSDNSTSFVKPAYRIDRLIAADFGTSKNDITHKFKTFEYASGGKVLKAYSYEYGLDKYSGYDSLVYNASGHLTAIYVATITGQGASAGLTQKNVFEWDTYYSNIIRKYSIPMRDGTETEDTTVTVYTYDNKVNYIAQQPILFNFQMDEPANALSRNNVLTAITTSGGDSEEISNVYTYDNGDYPISVTTTTKQLHNGAVVITSQKSRKLTYVRL
ncbi:hypothetical protein L3C95_09500 [Chitinophaga filiformis]|uniref:hypothetical protein n=1 Tax=Chitinophaga filiformis TaxID=104663 RepID=UPI001F32F908|nr:hypothetical protein [Chitinophaga filiformis]MCF6403108.1 hypothetical protein [Chitinophaga filiformis]